MRPWPLVLVVLASSCARPTDPTVVTPPIADHESEGTEAAPPSSSSEEPDALTRAEPATRSPEPATDGSALDDTTPPDPPPTWEWALATVPALAGHSEHSPSDDAFERFSRWFTGERSRTFYFRDSDTCRPVRGSVDGGFTYRETVTRDGNTRTRHGYDLQITRWGITESGPGGTTEERDARGRWHEIGGFGTGCASTLVHDSMSKVERGAVYFDAYQYTLTAECSNTIEDVQRCEGGGTRTCKRCGGVRLQPHASHRGRRFSSARWGRRAGLAPLHDCTQACPADEWTPRLAPLNAVLKGRTFHAVSGADEGVLFKSAKACRTAAKRVARSMRDAG